MTAINYIAAIISASNLAADIVCKSIAEKKRVTVKPEKGPELREGAKREQQQAIWSKK